ncbi:hypothetical protein V6N13_082621 [Hibiscus sabdariffa]
MIGCLEVEWSDSCVGLMLLWQDSTQVNLRSFSRWHIDVEIADGKPPFRFTGLYGSCYKDSKQEVWNLIDTLGQQSSMPWLIGGDLNEILDMSQAQWDARKIRQVFTTADAHKILQCPIAYTRGDILRWSHHQSRVYVTKTGHHWLEKQGNMAVASSKLWRVLSRAKGPYLKGQNWLEDVIHLLDENQFQFFLVLIWNA